MFRKIKELLGLYRKPISVLKVTDNQRKVDLLQYKMEQMPQVDCPLTHRFTPGLYYRELSVPKGTLAVTKIHKSEHPFVITKGKISVWIDGIGVKTFSAPYCDVTLPGTRRILFAHEDTVWMTFHPTKKTDPEEIEKDIIEPRDVGFELEESIKLSLMKGQS